MRSEYIICPTFAEYAGSLYEKYFKENSLNKYAGRLLQLSVPKLVVFYNGKKEQPGEMILKLSDSFPEGSDSDIEVKGRLLKVNVGRSRLLREACRALGEYSWMVVESEETIRQMIKTA